MNNTSELHWLPIEGDFRAKLRAAGPDELKQLARTRLDFLATNMLDRALSKHTGEPAQCRLAILSSCTAEHLAPAIRVGALRRNFTIQTYENAYGQYVQEMLDPGSDLHSFAPTDILFAFDAWRLAQLDNPLEHIRSCWKLAREKFGCRIMQQTVVNPIPALLGGNEHHLNSSKNYAIERLNYQLRDAAIAEGVALVAVDARCRLDGLMAWHDPALWHRSKQDIHPPAAPFYGDLVARVIGAQLGRSRKALVVDLDNTLWGGVIGDDGLGGIVLGQGSALGEGFLSVQSYVRGLAERGVILAVSSKNDSAVALQVFDKHPEMILRREHIASFRIDWNDKAANIRSIAAELNIGLDALVFLDDNPFERSLVREMLPEVEVPEIPEEPALIPHALQDAGYFEAISVTEEDRRRNAQYVSNRARDELKAETSDLTDYLASLGMRLIWAKIDEPSVQRVTQLINKTNQFNLTTLRYSEDQIRSFAHRADTLCLRFRLTDRFGDSGIISAIIGIEESGTLTIDSWVMSCRVLGRGVENAILNVLALEAKGRGVERLQGRYTPTAKNRIVGELYQSLGFVVTARDQDGGVTASLDLAGFTPSGAIIHVEQEKSNDGS